MPLAQSLADFHADLNQCEALIAHAHAVDQTGQPLLPPLDQRQITVAAVLNVFVAWETFLESALTAYMVGEPTLSGAMPQRYVSPPSLDAARALVIGVNRYFDYGNQDYLRKVVRMCFQNGYPFEPHLSSITGDLADLRTLRNSSAHITSTTQTALESLHLRIFAVPNIGVDLYTFATSSDPRSVTNETIFLTYKNKLAVTAHLIATG